LSQQADPLVATNNGGGFVAVWGSLAQDGGQFGVFAKRFDAGGQPQGVEFQVNSYTPQDKFPFGVAMDGVGGFVVTWASYQQDGSAYGVFARRFDSGGTPLGVEFQVNSYTVGGQGGGALAMAGSGDFVVAWVSYAGDGSDYRVFARRFDAAGLPLAAELQVSSYANDNQKGRPQAAMDDGGDFVVAWVSQDQDGSSDGVFAKQFQASGVAQGAEFQVNSYTNANQTDPSVAMNGDGDFVVIWDSGDGSDYGIFARRFAAAIPLDIDGDGSFEPLTDGLLVVRYGFGFRGATLINGAVAAGCTRCTAPAIEAYLADLAG
jgi:hypothetical protein